MHCDCASSCSSQANLLCTVNVLTQALPLMKSDQGSLAWGKNDLSHPEDCTNVKNGKSRVADPTLAARAAAAGQMSEASVIRSPSWRSCEGCVS